MFDLDVPLKALTDAASLIDGRLQPTANTPWKINMEPTNHPFRKEHDLANLDDYGPC